MFGRWKAALLVGLFSACLSLIFFLGREVFSELEGLATAQTDDVRWNMSQLEVELQRVQLAAKDVMGADDADLAEFRTRFDIFYSRITTISQSPLYLSLRDDGDARKQITLATRFLEAVTPIVDGPNDALAVALPSIRNRIDALLPEIRTLALIGVEKFVQYSGARRSDISNTLRDLVVSVVALVMVLFATIAVILRLYRQGQTASEEIHVVKSRFEAAITSSLEAVLVVDTEGLIVEYNGAAEAIFKYTREDAIGTNMAALLVPNNITDHHPADGMKPYLQSSKHSVVGAGRMRMQGRRKTGEIFPVELSISLAETQDQRVYVSYLRDITSELEAEEELRKARDEARAGEIAKSDMLTVMSHEMRTPLHGILGSLSLIEHNNLTARQLRHLNSIAVSGDLLLSHVNDVLDLSRLDSLAPIPQRTTFDLRDMTRQLMDSLRSNAEKRGNALQVEFLTDDLHSVFGHRTELQQCLMNLIGNAIKFTEGGVIALEMEKVLDGEMVEFRISDTGIGISSSDLERIFEEFVTIDTDYSRENPGTGLGLAITRRLVEMIGGEIQADSIEGEGSLFTLRAPLPDSAEEEASLEPPRLLHLDKNLCEGLSILVVEDNRINRMILKDMLDDLGCDVVQAADGFQGIEEAKKRCFDLMFLDISMPGLDGVQTLSEIRQLEGASQDTPAVAITALAAEKDRNRILEADFLDVLTKPVTASQIESKICDLFGVGMIGTTARDLDEDIATDFVARFGQDIFDKSAQQLIAALKVFANELALSLCLTPELKKTAHQLSGSAAVLGQQCIGSILQQIESHDGNAWAQSKLSFVSRLEQEMRGRLKNETGNLARTRSDHSGDLDAR